MKTLKDLENCFESAKKGNFRYAGIKVQLAEEGRTEIIITENKNFDFNLDYYRRAYTEDLKHKTNTLVKIIDCTFANTFEAIESYFNSCFIEIKINKEEE